MLVERVPSCSACSACFAHFRSDQKIASTIPAADLLGGKWSLFLLRIVEIEKHTDRNRAAHFSAACTVTTTTVRRRGSLAISVIPCFVVASVIWHFDCDSAHNYWLDRAFVVGGHPSALAQQRRQEPHSINVDGPLRFSGRDGGTLPWWHTNAKAARGFV
eukprot:SAG31_NODE_35_length_31836_cov_10.841352_10_plen_160_part_00